MKRLLFSLALITASTTGFAQTAEQSVRNYAAHVHASYAEALKRARELQTALTSFTRTPSVMTLDAAQNSWRFAREVYGRTEVFRFYNGPIDRDGGPEGLLNAWPLDEAYIDYVQGNPNAGIINNVAAYPQLNRELLVSLNENDGEKNISTGYHAIEFLLWGQDFYADGPGQRPYTDYTTAPNAGRRAQYLNLVAEMLVDDLAGLEREWRPNAANFRREFEAMPTAQAMKKILSGIIFMAGDELSGERMYVAYDTQGQEDEHSCFSDMTHMDILWNYLGVADVVDVTGILNLPAVRGSAAAQRIRGRMAGLPAQFINIPVPFDQAITDPTGRARILGVVEELEALAKDLVEVSVLLGAPVEY